MNRRVHPAFTIIIALGVLGFVYILTTNPGRLFTMLLSVVIIGAVMFFLFKWIVNRNSGSEGNLYRKAVRQSKRRYQHTKPKAKSHVKNRVTHLRSVPTDHKSKPVLLKKKSQTQLTVIEGKKNKKKNKALF
ncbi:SA1362 family protein [Bacillus sp. NPDC077027]|uniref:SA1362 family protein n=1 Tax=Bacillus sp. NPDC077027 TaxID=3390548 RepID=UPI003D00F1D0